MRHCSFDSSNSKQDFYRGAGCTEKFYEDLEKHATEVINYQKKEILPLIDEEIGSYNNQKFCHICKKKFYDVDDNNENSNDDSNGGDSSDEDVFIPKRFHGDATGLKDGDEYDEFDPRSFHSNASEPDIDNDDGI